MLGSGPKPRRTVFFALFGSEESGGLGSSYFLQHPPVPLTDIVANLEFEMIGRPDPKYPKDDLWLSGWERSNLGPSSRRMGQSWWRMRVRTSISSSARTITCLPKKAWSRRRLELRIARGLSPAERRRGAHRFQTHDGGHPVADWSGGVAGEFEFWAGVGEGRETLDASGSRFSSSQFPVLRM